MSSYVQEAWKAYREGRFEDALNLFQIASEKLGVRNFKANIRILQKRLLTCNLSHGEHGKKLRVAAIMDEFTCQCYAPECELLELHPDIWQSQMEEFKPELLFIESAWQGKNSTWKLKISTFSETLQELLAWSRSQGIPSLLWNKEDPVHYSTFLPLAKAVDVVFTTDIDCIPLYKHEIGHDRVYLLPFAAQPSVHNPVEKYTRQDKFCFAGSYYVKYPERQRDFSMLMTALEKHLEVAIYDRNFDNKHPHYQFPERYNKYILGKLPYSEIDRAYKGYTFGINMNTLKQSQSMFARRVYEMAASNTIVVSNFSRGMRNFFGDLVISGDDSQEIEHRLRPLLEDAVLYRKQRLLALRHVLSQHTYKKRLEYIKEKIWHQHSSPVPEICLIAQVTGSSQAALILEHFQRQKYTRKSLWLVGSVLPSSLKAAPNVHIVPNMAACQKAIHAYGKAVLIGMLRAEHWYGPHYLTDLALTLEYSSCDVFGKGARYTLSDKSFAITLIQDGTQYQNTSALPVWASLCRFAAASQFWKAILSGKQIITGKCFAIDEFNFVENGASLDNEYLQPAQDMQLHDTGIDFYARLLPLSEQLSAKAPLPLYEDSSVKILSARELAKMFKSSKEVQLSLDNDILSVTSHLPQEKYVYCHGAVMERKALNLHLNSCVAIRAEGDLDLRFTFTFLDENRKKLGHHISKAGKFFLAIPEDCRFIHISLRIEGPGVSAVGNMHIGAHNLSPSVLVCRSPYLVLAKQYPAYDDLYRYGFLHTRLAGYRKAGQLVDMFRFQKANTQFREFEGIDVATGDARLLDATLATGQIRHVCVHFMDRDMWAVLKKYLNTIRVIVWIHGAEIQHWKRREFEFIRMTTDEIDMHKKRTQSYKSMWQEILSTRHKNIHFVFVSQNLKKESEQDIEMEFPKGSYSIIHNFIDGNLFEYQQKTSSQRFNILSIRPYSSLTYANDLSVSSILELRKRPDFDRYRFTLVGDGPLFEDITRPVAHFSNVILERRFLTHAEMKERFSVNGVFLTPTRCDSQGVSRDEAMAAGLVPITNAVSAVPEFVDASCGFLAPAEDSAALADAMEELATNPNLFLTMSRKAAQQVRKLSGFEQTIARELRLITEQE